MNINCAQHSESYSEEHVFKHTFHLNKRWFSSLFIKAAEEVDQAKGFFQVNSQKGQKLVLKTQKEKSSFLNNRKKGKDANV